METKAVDLETIELKHWALVTNMYKDGTFDCNPICGKGGRSYLNPKHEKITCKECLGFINRHRAEIDVYHESMKEKW